MRARARSVNAALIVLLIVIPSPWVQAQTGGKWREYPTRYYVVHSDLDEDTVREACLRVTALAEEYQSRTSGFTGKITTRLPFYLYSRLEDYQAAGGIPNSGGMYDGKRLMATVTPPVKELSWYIIQHEGFHQFVDVVIGGDIPVWVNEGLAGYFEEAIFTGDGMIAGLVPQDRLERIRSRLGTNQHSPFRDMMLIRQETWNHAMSVAYYDQAWSMVHFLAHAENGKYRPFFDGFLRDVSRKGLAWDIAWKQNFGVGVDEFEEKWRAYWLALPDDPTAGEYDRAAVAKLTSFLARATAAGQSFGDFQVFSTAIREGGVRALKDGWLPASLGKSGLERAGTFRSCAIEGPKSQKPRLVCETATGAKLAGSFQLKGKKVTEVRVQ